MAPTEEFKDKIIPQPDFSLPPPTSITTTGSIADHPGVTFVAGEGYKPADVMFVAPHLLPQEASKFLKSRDGKPGFRVQPRYLRSDAGTMFSDIFAQEGLNLRDSYYTAVIKWLLPKNERAKIPKNKVTWALAALEDEIKRVQPKIIVCVGKLPFDLLSDVKLSISDAKGGWFFNSKYNAKIYLVEDIYKLVSNPEYIERFRVDAREIHTTLQEIKNVNVNRVPLEYTVISNSNELKRLVETWKVGNFKVFSVDCEWAGGNHVDGALRSTQFCWAPGVACYVRWMDDKGNYVFDIPYKEAGDILATWLNRSDVKYIGHHFSADAPWLNYKLGLDWYEKCIFDTEFAQQTANEYEELSLERIAMKYTDLGRYDLPLVLWKKQNKALMLDGGYGAIPDDILIDYAMKDVDTVFRAWPIIRKSLDMQSLSDYYDNIFNPFVTDVFISFALVGLPIDIPMMDELREVYSFARDKMEVLIQAEIHSEAISFVLKAFIRKSPTQAMDLYNEFLANIKQGEHTAAWEVLKGAAVKADDVPKLKAIFEHFLDSPTFNIRSAPHLKRWLFNVKEYEPIKSTNQKDKGLPSTSWEKVKSMPPEARKHYKPAVDKQTLQILSETNNDPILRRLLQFNAVGNVCKAFLKEAEVDEEGNVVKENGLHLFVCQDDCIHGQMSTTETGRPRSWKPNSLNLPGYVNKMISVGICDLFSKLLIKDELPDKFKKFIAQDEEGEYTCLVPPIRSCIKAPPGWCFVESDYQTAEIRGLAFISGDKSLIDIVCLPDVNFAILPDDKGGEDKKVRLCFPPDGSISEAVQKANQHLLYSPEDPSLIRKPDGSLKHPKQDLHWSLAEMVHGKPRELLDEKKDRGAAKVGNFCIAEDELVLTRTGLKPIQLVLACDLLWDGVEWVKHEGVVYSGEKSVIEYQGLRATYLHDVWTEEAGKIKFWEARAQQFKLVRSERTCPEYKHIGFGNISGVSEEDRQRLLCRLDALSVLRNGEMERSEKYGEGVLSEVYLSESHEDHEVAPWYPASSDKHTRLALSSYDTALRERHPCLLRSVQVTRNKSGVHVQTGLHALGVNNMAQRGLQGQGFRSYRQQRQLFENESTFSRQVNQPNEPRVHAGNTYRTCTSFSGTVPWLKIYGTDCTRTDTLWVNSRADTGKTQHKSSSRPQKTRVYDIINAGPRNRFTCQGVLVSNSSAYGASASTLERKIEQDTSKKPEEGTGEKLLKALQKRQPVAQEFLVKMENTPQKPGYYRAASGRLRHFISHGDKYMDQLDENLTSGLFRSMGREARNFPMQESVAATAARAGKWLLDTYIRLGMKARPLIILYDSVVTLCPLSERFEVAKFHQTFMTDVNTWHYHGRDMSYPIDTDFVYRWSSKPSKTDKKLLNDNTWNT